MSILRWTSALAVPALMMMPAATPGEELPLHRVPAAASTIMSDIAFQEGTPCGHTRRFIRLLTPQVVVGEPILFEIKLVGDPPPDLPAAEFVGRLSLGRDVRAFVFPPRGAQPFEVTLPGGRAMAPNVTYTLQKNEVVSNVYSLASDDLSPNGAVAYQPGTFGLPIVMTCQWTDQNTPQPVEEIFADFVVEVRADEGPDATALAILGREGMALIQGTPPESAAHITTLERVVRETPTAALRPHALATLAGGLLHRGTRIGGDTQLVEQSIPWFEMFLNEYPDHPSATMMRYRYIRALNFTGRRDEARRQFERMWSDPAQTLVFRPMEELRERYFGQALPPLTGDWMVLANPADSRKPDSYEVEREAARAQMSMEDQLLEAIREAGLEMSEDFEIEVREGGLLP